MPREHHALPEAPARASLPAFVPRSKYCISAKAMEDHLRAPKHKRRLKTLTTEKIYDHAEANAAAGRGSVDHGGIELREEMRLN